LSEISSVLFVLANPELIKGSGIGHRNNRSGHCEQVFVLTGRDFGPAVNAAKFVLLKGTASAVP
jgi:hypothetical protein